MVLYSGRDGMVAFTRCNDLPDAIAQVERLRNEESVEQVQIFRLEEVKFEMKPYYRVEIPSTAVFDKLVPDPFSFASTTEPEFVTRADEDLVAAGRFTDMPAMPMTADVPAMVTPPPPPPPPPPPAAPMTYASASIASDDTDAAIGTRRGLFGR
jgi:hypothetical protein